MTKTPSLLLAGLLLACGGSGDSGPVDSGLPADKTGVEFSADDVTALCDALDAHAARVSSPDDAHNVECVRQGYEVALEGNMSAETCQIAYKMCIEMEFEPGDGQCTFNLSDCTASVAEIEACLTVRNEAYAESFRDASCERAVAEGTPFPAIPELPECTKIESTCPGV
jgi:hypothetical protein